jgi:hypothetical protein
VSRGARGARRHPQIHPRTRAPTLRPSKLSGPWDDENLAPIAVAHEIWTAKGPPGQPMATKRKVQSIYRGLCLDRRITFDARFWLAAAARFDTTRGLTRDVLFETGEDLGALRSTALAAGAF